MNRVQTLMGITTGAIGVLLMISAKPQNVSAIQPYGNEAGKVTLCHATAHNRYQQLTVDFDSVVRDHGHDGHDQDIIPPFDYTAKNGTTDDQALRDRTATGEATQRYNGKNWDAEHQIIFDNDCAAPSSSTLPDPAEPTTTAPASTTTEPATTAPTTATTEPATTAWATTAPPVPSTTTLLSQEAEAPVPTSVVGLPITGGRGTSTATFGGVLVLVGITMLGVARRSSR